MFDFSEYQEFEWDAWNIKKNEHKHHVTIIECEQIFADPLKRIMFDKRYSIKKETRFILIGSTEGGRVLYVAFTIRSNRIRVISARDLNRKERYLYP